MSWVIAGYALTAACWAGYLVWVRAAGSRESR